MLFLRLKANHFILKLKASFRNVLVESKNFQTMHESKTPMRKAYTERS